jgi:hypothetical protein
MDPLLFLGSEYLRKMTDPTISEEEREDYRAELAAYLSTEEGGNLSVQLVRAFNKLDLDELLTLPKQTVNWYMDWLGSSRPALMEGATTESLAHIWWAYSDEVIRTRAIELILMLESAREGNPAESRILSIARRLVHAEEWPPEGQRELEGRPAGDFEMTLQIVDTLLTERSTFSLRVLGSLLRITPAGLGTRLSEHVKLKAAELGERSASDLLGQVFRRGEE